MNEEQNNILEIDSIVDEKGEPISFTIIDPDRKPAEAGFVNRITVVEKTYFQTGNEQPTVVDNVFSREITIDEDQVFVRKCKLQAEESKPIDLGWFEPSKIGMIIIENLVGKKSLLSFTEKQPPGGEDSFDRTAFVAVNNDGATFALIPPGDNLRFTPLDASKLSIKAFGTAVSCRINIYPA